MVAGVYDKNQIGDILALVIDAFVIILSILTVYKLLATSPYHYLLTPLLIMRFFKLLLTFSLFAASSPMLLANPVYPSEGLDKYEVSRKVLDTDWVDEITGANVEERGIDVEIFVDPGSGDDSAQGTRNSPLQTLKAALGKAGEANGKGRAVKITLLPGRYHEENIFDAAWNDELLVIEGTSKEDVILTGSEIWNGADYWNEVGTAEDGATLYKAKWTKDWGEYLTQSSGSPARGAPALNGMGDDDGSAFLEWDMPEGVEAASFNIYRRHTKTIDDSPAENSFKLVAEEVAGNTYSDKGLQQGLTWHESRYQYYVTAVSANGQESGKSNTMEFAIGTISAASRPNYLGRRREMVFVDGEILQQVKYQEQLKAGTFYVHDGLLGERDDGYILMCLPEGTSIDDALIEVSTLSNNLQGSLLRVSSKKNFVLRNVTIKHSSSRLWNTGALTLERCENTLVENCDFFWNNGRGIATWNCKDMTIQDSRALYSGGTGMGGWGEHNMVYKNIETAYGNWRGKWGNISGWFFGGIKTGFGQRGTKVINHHTHHNYCQGLWFDYNNKNIYIEGLKSHNNYSNGLFIEASFGPCIVKNSFITFNGEYGLHHANMPKTAVLDCVILGNKAAQLDVIDWVGRGVKDSDDGKEYALNEGYLTWRGNAVVSLSKDAPVVNAPSHAHVIDTFVADTNLYWHPKPEVAFNISDLGYSLEQWQIMTGQDLNSVFADPKFKNPENHDFAVADDSPILNRNRWKKRDVSDPGSHRLAEMRLEAAAVARNTPFPTLDGNERFVPLDLAKYANRPVMGTDAWIGLDFPQLTEFETTIHGVPFQITDQSKNDGMAVIALRSNKMQQSLGNEIAPSTELLYGDTAESFFILHGAGYIGEFKQIATYELVYEDGTTHEVEIMAVGDGGHDTDIMNYRTGAAQVQDWWPSNFQFNNDHVRNVLMINKESPKDLPAYLYNFELANPHPEKVVKSLRFSVEDPKADHCLLICAVTARK